MSETADGLLRPDRPALLFQAALMWAAFFSASHLPTRRLLAETAGPAAERCALGLRLIRAAACARIESLCFLFHALQLTHFFIRAPHQLDR